MAANSARQIQMRPDNAFVKAEEIVNPNRKDSEENVYGT